jgi:hypothetical protein
MIGTEKQHRIILQSIARRVMFERGLLPDFSVEALTELVRVQARSDTERLPIVS